MHLLLRVFEICNRQVRGENDGRKVRYVKEVREENLVGGTCSGLI